MTSASVHRLGFSVLADGEVGKAKPIANIVFVHGLRGHPRHTWEHKYVPSLGEKEKAKPTSSRFFKWRSPKTSQLPSNTETESGEIAATITYWPRDLLPKKVDNARILTYGYDADVIGCLIRGASKNNITQYGRDLMLQLEREVSGEPIIFVAHSLGGILVKEGLQWSKSDINPRHQEVHRCTEHVVFLGVPHRGSEMANMGQTVARLANVALQDTNSVIVSSLAVDDEILDRIHTAFMKMVHKEDFTVHSFQEGRGLSGMKGFSGKVVNDFSSILGNPLEVVETIDANHMEMVQFGNAEDPGYRKVSGVIADHVMQLQQKQDRGCQPNVDVSRPNINDTLSTVSTVDRKRHFNVPHISNQHFIGRTKELEWIHAHLGDLAVGAQQRRLVIWGAGGTGKTELVSTYAYRNKPKYSAVFWVTASSKHMMRKTYAKIAKYLELALPPENDQQTAIDEVRDWFTDQEPGDWLLVIDNADNLDEVDLRNFIPTTNKGSVIITSRNRQAAGFGQAIELGDMEAEDAITLLLRRAGVNASSSHESVAAEIAKSLGYLALAIEHAGAYIHSVGETLPNYQQQLQNNRRKMLEKRPGVSMHKESVFETFNMAFDTLKERSMAAVRMLCFFGFLDGDLISEDSLLLTDEGIADFAVEIVKDRQKYHDAIQELLSFSLIRISVDEDKKSISLHPLVHYMCRARLNLENQWVWRENAVNWLLRSLCTAGADSSVFPHLREILHQLQDPGDLPTNLPRRRRTFLMLSILVYHYFFAWHLSAAMTELYTYSGMIQDVLEESEDEIWLAFAAGFLINVIRQETSLYVSSDETNDQILRQYLVRRMTSSAASALQEAGAEEDSRKTTVQSGMSRLDDAGADRDIPFDVTTLTSAVLQGSSLQPTVLPTQSGKDLGQNRDYQTRDKATKHITEPSTPPDATPHPVNSANDSDDKSPSKKILHESTSFHPSCLSDIFVCPSDIAAYYVAPLKGLSMLYYSHQRKAEADLLLAWSTLPLDVPSDAHPHFQDTAQALQVQQLLLEASRFAAARSVNSLLDTYCRIMAIDKLSQQGHHTALEYAIMMNKTGRPEEAEIIIKGTFYQNTEQLEEKTAKNLTHAYVWMRKTLAESQILQRQVDEGLQTLSTTLQTVHRCFGRNSLSSLHAVYLLRDFYGKDHRFHSEAEAKKFDEEFITIFANLYTRDGKVSPEGLEMGMVLWTQGALEETVHVFDAFLRLATISLGEDDALTQRARRASTMAKREWDEYHAGTEVDLLKYGTILFPRKMETLTKIVDGKAAP